jgi:hypothetical protein
MWQLSPKAEEIRRREQAAINERLKAQKREPIGDYELDLRLFGAAPFGHPCRHEFLIRCWNHQWPNHLVVEVGDLKNFWLIRMAKDFCRHKRLGLLGCASAGKSYALAAYTYTFWKSQPFSTSIYLSTTSAEAGEARAFGTVKDLFHKDEYRVGKLINSLRLITLDEETKGETGEVERDYRNCVKAVLIKSGAEGKNVVGTIVGRKNKNVIWGCDEAGFMDAGILDARVNLFSNPFAQFIYVGNGPVEGDPVFIDGEPHGVEFPDGWRSVDPDIHFHWKSRTGHVLYFDGRKSPNMQLPVGAKPVFPGMIDREKMAEIEQAAGGEDTPIYWRQVVGLAPGVDVPDKLVTHKLLESNRAFEKALWAGTPLKVVGGLDVGFRMDGDPCSIDFCKVGKETDGRTVAEFERDALLLIPSIKSKEAFEPQIAEKVIAECRKRDCHYITMDITGDGGILLQHIERRAREEKYTLEVVPVSFSGAADDSVVIPDQKKLASEQFANKMSQIWGQFRLCVINKTIRGCDQMSSAVKQLVGRKFITDDKKRFLVESKREYKKRLKRSPDQADARTLATFSAIKNGLSGVPVSPGAVAAARKEERAAAVPRYSAGHGSRALYGGR